jgi:hypothetical protein
MKPVFPGTGLGTLHKERGVNLVTSLARRNNVSVTGPTVKSVLIAALAVVATGGAGVALGLSGLVSAPTISAGVAPGDGRSVAAASCIEGPVAAVLPAGARVVAVARSENGAWTGVRTAYADRVVWLQLGVVTVDQGEPDVASLPVGGACPEVVIPADPTVPTSEPTEPPGPAPGPAPDTTPPTLGVPTATATSILCLVDSTTISVAASDDRGVSRVEIVGTGYDALSTTMAQSWSYTYTPSGQTDAGTTTFHIRAFDAAGNASAQRTIAINVDCVG